ncbi:MAG: PAS domain S-box protein [Smithellaceae bacterium]
MLVLDIRTILFSYVLTNIVCLAVMVLLWRQNRTRIAGTTFWVANYSCQTAALLLIVLRGTIPDGMSIVLANALVITGAFLGYMGLLRFAGARRVQIYNYLFLAAIVAIHLFFTYVRPDVEARTANTSFGLLVVMLQCAWLLLYSAPPATRRLGRGVGLVFAVYALVSLARILHYFVLPQNRVDFFEPSLFDAASMLTYQLLFVALTYSLALLYNKKLIEDIRTEEEKYNKAFHSSPYGMILTRLSDGKIIEVNDGFLQIAGYEAPELRRITTLSLNIWPTQEDRAMIVDELAKNGSVRNRKLQFRRKNGEMLTGLLSADMLTIHGEKCILGSLNDVTAQSKMEAEVRRSETLLRTVMDNLPIGIAVNSVDPDVHFEYINDNFIRFYRTTKEALAGPVGFWEAVYEDPQFREELKSKVLADSLSNDPRRMHWPDVPVTRKGQKTTYVTARNIPIPGEALVISTVWDVTAHKDAEEEIRRLNEQLEQKVAQRTRELHDSQLALLNIVDDLNESAQRIASANAALEAVNKELSAFSYSVSHDLRAPLRSIDGFGSALMEDYADRLDGTAKDYLARIRRATQNMGHLIDDMLKLSRVTRAEFNRELVDLSEMVESLASGARENQTNRQIAFRIQEGLAVTADRHLLNIALVNLIDNAVKFTSKKTQAEIVFGCVEKDGQTEYYLRDNGVGFDMAYVGKLFGTFQRLHTTQEFEGTGIGLATVRRVITRHGGTIRAEGEVGKGAAFFFTIPEV